MPAMRLEDRAVLEVKGEDAESFLQGLVTNDVVAMPTNQLQFAAMLSPQGKIMFDFLLARAGDRFLIDVPHASRAGLKHRLTLYRLRARVELTDLSPSLRVVWSPEALDAPFRPDPRREGAGSRAFVPLEDAPMTSGRAAWDRIRIALGLPEAGRDFIFGEAFPHEANMDRLNGLSFKKGCYMGQEVVSRMQHRGLTRSRVLRVSVEGPPPPPFEEIRAGDTLIGRMGSSFEGAGLAMMRLDRVEEAIAAGRALVCAAAVLRVLPPMD